MRKMIMAISALGLLAVAGVAQGQTSAKKATTVVLVHGAFAGSSSWNPVIERLARDGYPVIAAANPLRGVKGDSEYVARIVRNVHGPVVLVGHSYGGAVISVAAAGADNVKSLVYVAGFAAEPGESATSLGAKFPTGTLGPSLAPPVPLAGGTKDLYIDQAKYWHQFAADLPQAQAVVMAANQRPCTENALTDPIEAAAWKTIPSWFVWGAEDRNIPNTLHAFMAKRAHAREAVEIKGASHVVMLSHSREVADMIERAAEAK